MPDDAGTPPGRAPLWIRIAGFVAVVAVGVALVVVVVRRDAGWKDDLAARGEAATTVALPPDNGGSAVPPTTVPAVPPAATGTTAGGRATAATVAQRLEAAIKRRTGWTHKVACFPAGPVVPGAVLSCGAATEPQIAEVPPSEVLAVVGDDGRTVVWVQGTTGPLAADALEPAGLTCAQLQEQGFSWVAVLAYWTVHDRPSDLDPDGTGRPCTGTYPAAAVDEAVDAAV